MVCMQVREHRLRHVGGRVARQLELAAEGVLGPEVPPEEVSHEEGGGATGPVVGIGHHGAIRPRVEEDQAIGVLDDVDVEGHPDPAPRGEDPPQRRLPGPVDVFVMTGPPADPDDGDLADRIRCVSHVVLSLALYVQGEYRAHRSVEPGGLTSPPDPITPGGFCPGRVPGSAMQPSSPPRGFSSRVVQDPPATADRGRHEPGVLGSWQRARTTRWRTMRPQTPRR